MLKLLILLFFMMSFSSIAQFGGKKREHYSGGSWHVLKRQRSPWKYHNTKPGLSQNKEQRFLFKRSFTKNSTYRDAVIKRQNKYRSKHRKRGNVLFYKKKYF